MNNNLIPKSPSSNNINNSRKAKPMSKFANIYNKISEDETEQNLNQDIEEKKNKDNTNRSEIENTQSSDKKIWV